MGGVSFQSITDLANASGPPGPLMETYSEIHIVSRVWPIDQGMLLASKSYYLRHTFHRDIAITGNDSFDGLGQSTFKIL